MHDGLLQPEDIAYNYALDARTYRPANWSASGVSALPSASPTPYAVLPSCPSSWTSTTHYLKSVSMVPVEDYAAAASGGVPVYARACSYSLYAGAYTTDITYAGDSTHIVRFASDGSSPAAGTFSLQSAQQPDRYMAPLADPLGYVYYDSFGLAIADKLSNRTRGVWYADYQPDGSFILRSKAAGMTNWAVSKISANPGEISARTCFTSNVNYTNNFKVFPPSAGVPPQRFLWTVGILSQTTFNAAIWKSERVVLESADAIGSTVSASVCPSGRAIVNNDLGLLNQNAAFNLVPALACTRVCGNASFSLRFGSSSYLYATASGGLQVGPVSDLAFTPEGASFMGRYDSIGGVSGWVIWSALAPGLVLTKGSADSCSDPACCWSNTSSLGLSMQPLTQLSLSNLWIVQWEDGSGALTSMPSSGYTAPACPPSVLSSTPVPSGTGTAAASVTLSSSVSVTCYAKYRSIALSSSVRTHCNKTVGSNMCDSPCDWRCL